MAAEDYVTFVGEIASPVKRAVLAGELIHDRQEEVAQLAVIRRDAIKELLAGGMNQSEVAELLDVTRARVSHILNRQGRR